MGGDFWFPGVFGGRVVGGAALDASRMLLLSISLRSHSMSRRRPCRRPLVAPESFQAGDRAWWRVSGGALQSPVAASLQEGLDGAVAEQRAGSSRAPESCTGRAGGWPCPQPRSQLALRLSCTDVRLSIQIWLNWGDRAQWSVLQPSFQAEVAAADTLDLTGP